METRKVSKEQIEQYLQDIEETAKNMEEEDQAAVRSFQRESIEKRAEFIREMLKNL